MRKLVRFGVSLEETLVKKFDAQIKDKGYRTRSKAIGDLIRESMVRQEWAGGTTVAGAIILVYDHHKREVTEHLTHIQHDHHDCIVSSQHVHLDHNNCLEVIVVRGKPSEARKLAAELKAVKGVKHSSLTAATTGRDMDW